MVLKECQRVMVHHYHIEVLVLLDKGMLQERSDSLPYIVQFEPLFNNSKCNTSRVYTPLYFRILSSYFELVCLLVPHILFVLR